MLPGNDIHILGERCVRVAGPGSVKNILACGSGIISNDDEITFEREFTYIYDTVRSPTFATIVSIRSNSCQFIGITATDLPIPSVTARLRSTLPAGKNMKSELNSVET